jgi:hypothetical protein
LASTGVQQLYRVGYNYFNKPPFTTKALAAKRLRMITRLLALEDICREHNVEALPGRTIEVLRQLVGLKEQEAKEILSERRVRQSNVQQVQSYAWSVPPQCPKCSAEGSFKFVEVLERTMAGVFECVNCGLEYHSGAVELSIP